MDNYPKYHYKKVHLLSVVWLGDEAENIDHRLREGRHRRYELQLARESPASQEPGHGDDGRVQHVNQEPGITVLSRIVTFDRVHRFHITNSQSVIIMPEEALKQKRNIAVWRV